MEALRSEGEGGVSLGPLAQYGIFFFKEKQVKVVNIFLFYLSCCQAGGVVFPPVFFASLSF